MTAPWFDEYYDDSLPGPHEVVCQECNLIGNRQLVTPYGCPNCYTGRSKYDNDSLWAARHISKLRLLQ